MSSISVAGDVSGAVSIVAPSVAGSTVLTLPAVSGTLVSTGNAVSFPSVTTPIVNSATTLQLQTNGTTTAVTIDASQNVGIGTSSPASLGQLVISKASSGTAVLAFESQGSWNSSIKTDTQNLIFSNPAATERMRIDSSGSVGVGCIPIANTTNAQLQVQNGIGVVGSNTGINGNVYYASGWKYFGNGSGAQISLNRDATRAIEINVFANNTGGAGVAASLITAVDIDVSGNVMIRAADTSGAALSIVATSNSNAILRTSNNSATYANGATLASSSKSGMLIVNNQIMGGVAMWLCGGGVVTLVSSAGTGGGTVAYSAPSYVWTNNSGSTGLFSFTWFQTRDAV